MKCRQEIRVIVVFALCAITLQVQASASDQSNIVGLNTALPPNALVLSIAKSNVGNKVYSFVKYVETKNDGHRFYSGVILDPNGKIIQENEIPYGVPPIVSSELQNLISKNSYDTTLHYKVRLGLYDQHATNFGTPSYGLVVKGASGVVSKRVNGQPVGEAEVAGLLGSRISELKSARHERIARNRDVLYSLVTRHRWLADEEIFTAVEDGQTSVSVSLTAKQIQEIADSSKDLVQGIEPQLQAIEGIASAMQYTHIDPYAIHSPYDQYTRGGGVGIYQTELHCPDNGFPYAPNYYKIQGSTNEHCERVCGILAAVAPDASLYCKSDGAYLQLPTEDDLDGYDYGAPIHIVTTSAGWLTNNITTDDRDWDNFVYDNEIPAFVLAHNQASYICSPGKGFNVITVGSLNELSSSWSTFSNYVNTPYQFHNDKPEICAPGEQISSGGYGPDNGTSYATPHAAAMLADMTSDEPDPGLAFRPALAKAALLASSRRAISGGFDKVGLGGIDWLSWCQWSELRWWNGDNNAWATFDLQDDFPGDGFVNFRTYLMGSRNARIVLVWLNRGTFTYSQRNHDHAIGIDLDLWVASADGQYYLTSTSWDNPFEYVDFTVPASGTYTVTISRYVVRDAASKLEFAVCITQ